VSNNNLIPPNPAKASREAWRNHNSKATTLLVLFVDRYVLSDEEGEGKEAWDWDPETIQQEIYDDYGVKLGDNLDKLIAAMTILTRDLFFKNERCFVTLANVLSNHGFHPGEFVPAGVAECAWAVTEGLLLRPPEPDDPEPFSHAVRYYIGAALGREGFLHPPDILRIALNTADAKRVRIDWQGSVEFEELTVGQKQKNQEIESVIRDGLAELMSQLQSLPLQHGDVAELKERIRQSIATRPGRRTDRGTRE
jgi:hypothetical protein